ncbi:hypothetical protein H0H92_006894 [Tricholoma furcatifolium]|nr:hypothetical protein H0H92_006894 [Tricholoma furcatifolium]
MAAMLETPSRVWRRIEAVENRDMPSLPSLPGFEDSDNPDPLEDPSETDDDASNISSPMTSTPAPASAHHTIATIRPSSSTSSTARFASSIDSRRSSLHKPASFRGESPYSKGRNPDSFDISRIPSLPDISTEAWGGKDSDENSGEGSKDSVPDIYLPPGNGGDGEESEDMSFDDPPQPVNRKESSRYSSLSMEYGGTPKKNHDYSIDMKSETKQSPFDKYRNVALRKTAARTRTPSLTRTTSSPTTSPAQSTPQSNRSFSILSDRRSPATPSGIPLPRSTTTSPVTNELAAQEEASEHGQSVYDADVRSMEITDVQISPPQVDDQSYSDEHVSTSIDDEHQQGSEQGQEPTFSSEGDATPYAQNRLASPQLPVQSPGHISSTFTSPSIAFTPTPAFPRPRARFNLPVPGDLLDTPEPPQHESGHNDEDHEEESHSEEPLTPSRRKSFLLSVINSTTRPRLKFPTPHPRRNGVLATPMATPSIAESTPGPGVSSAPRTSLQSAFAGVTPRPRSAMNRNPRLPHPLSQAILLSPGAADSESKSPASGTGSNRRQSLDGWAPTSGNFSPYDGLNDKASFVSTASSHDLTTHHRVNTSFDPAMGFGAGAGQGLGRFNANKLNNYLHGLNRRLQEENEALIERLRKLEEEKKEGLISPGQVITDPLAAETGRRRSSVGKRVSIGGILGDVTEEVGAEGWGEEKAELEELVESLKGEKERVEREKDQLEEEKENIRQALEGEKEGRASDRESWKRRMFDVEEGVEGIIKDLEGKIEVAEKKARDVEEEKTRNVHEMQKRLLEVEEERDIARRRVEQVESALESENDLGGELREAHEQVDSLEAELGKTRARVKELEDEATHDFQKAHEAIDGLQDELNARSEELRVERGRTQQLDQDIQVLEEELEAMKAHLDEMEEGAVTAVERLDSLEDELLAAKDEIRTLNIADEEARDTIEKLESDVHDSQELARQMETALHEAETKMQADDDEFDNLRAQIATLERERDRFREASLSQDTSRSSGKLSADVNAANAEIEALEEELDSANREIARLNTMLSQSPARKAMEKARDLKVEHLEREKEELLERNKALRMAMNDISTPSRVINTSTISPIHRQVLSMSIRAPRTPGAPLKDLSWLNTTSADPTTSPLIAEINRLQKELDRANESIDDKLDKLEDAGLGVVGLTKKLEDARAKISALEDEIARLSRREERRIRRLERARCQKCHIKIDVSKLNQTDESTLELTRDDLASEPPTPATKTSEGLRAELKAVNSQLQTMKEEWNQERRALLGENAILQDATNRLNAQMKSAKEEMKKATETGRASEKAATNVQEELDKAKRVITDLEADLKSERSQLRALTTQQAHIQREKGGILSQLQRTESDMDDVKKHLQKYKKENHDLEKELRENANMEQKARLLEGRVAENAETIEHLRHERSLLAADHKALQHRFSAISEEADRLRTAYSASSTSHDNRRHQLDLHLLEIDDLRRALSNKASELHKAEQEKQRVSAEKSDVARTVAVLEADLRRVKKDAEAFGRDLKLLRTEKDRQEEKHKQELTQLERTKKQAQTQIRLLTEQLDNQRLKTGRAREELQNHVCAADERQLTSLKAQHNAECKGLFVQIRYLKAKFTRESSFRGDLVYQKNHLLVLLAQFERSEQTIFASIARIGFPVSIPLQHKRPRKLKSVALVVIFLSRTSRAKQRWQEHVKARQSVTDALEDVRKRRTKSS